MRTLVKRAALAALIINSLTTQAAAQTHRSADPVIHAMWQVGMEQSQVADLAQVLMDSIGPRLTGSPELASAQDWLVDLYGSWGVTVRKEEYGSYLGWRQGTLHVDLIAPRVQTLEAEFLAWSPGTDGPVEGEVINLWDVARGEPEEWLPRIAGKWVLVSPAEPMCRAPHELEQNARPETVSWLEAQRDIAQEVYTSGMQRYGGFTATRRLLHESEALGFLTLEWSRGWGVNKVFTTWTRNMPSLDLSCEDYGMLARMVARGQGPRIRVDADAETLGEVPQFNVILSAHLDSWHAATGTTDNGTGTITMLEAMRILKQTYPNPRRTILVGHWGAEEMGHIGSRAFAEDHADLMDDIQVVFNQDNGTWRVEKIEGQGLLYAGQHIARWMSLVPDEMSEHITLEFPGRQNNRGSDHISFLRRIPGACRATGRCCR
jgi:hypothetical protein